MPRKRIADHFRLDTSGKPVQSWTSFVIGLVSLPVGLFVAGTIGVGLSFAGVSSLIVVPIALACFFAVPIAAYMVTFRLTGGRKTIPEGHCPSCGYDLTGLDPRASCPECGVGREA